MSPSRTDPRTQGTESNGAPDSQASIPDAKSRSYSPAVGAEVDLPVTGNVIETAADDAEGHRPQCDVGDEAWLTAASDVAAITEPNGNDDAGDDHQRVGA